MVDISICIVTLKACDLLHDCLRSIEATPPRRSLEITVVDNYSCDGTIEMLQSEFPAVRVIQNQKNEGFGRPTNQAMKVSQGRYLLLLNPDTLVLPGAIDALADFLDGHPEVGICGPKVLNRDGSMQKPCRRGESRPLAVIAYFSGLSTRFPKNRALGEYLMSYMDEDEIHPVAGVSGSCMLIRSEVVKKIGYLDEQFFAFQEDADYCLQTRRAGWQVFYVPTAQITHFGSMGGSRVQPYRSIFEWHKSYFLHYRKNFAKDYFFLFNWIYYLVMLIKLVLSLGINFFRKEKFAGKRKP